MEPKRSRSEVYWFFAACLALAAFILVLAAIEVSAGLGWSLRGITLLTLAALALGVMAMLMALAFKVERGGAKQQ